MALQLHNTLTRRKEPFVPRDEGRVGIYLCGPTVYAEPHIGNLRPVVVFDVLRRHLAASGYEVLYVRNYTDVDDKIINAAGHDPLRAFAVAEHWPGSTTRSPPPSACSRPTSRPGPAATSRRCWP